MKLLFISDIHGSVFYLKKAIEVFEKEKADQMIILGDLLYHGPRNPLPKEYSPQEVLTILNEYKDKIISVKGNCDSEVDQMVLEFPIMAEYSIIFNGKKKVFATHGHKFNKDNVPNISDEDILIHGHTHIPVAERLDNIILLNPGSISLPKENNPNTYGIMTDTRFEIKDFDDNELLSINL